ncbi:unnamed protein product [Phytophthora fragariaefolia]|uniref:Unnamed protein product n=1 Tax=Phytophthora fragariaefolia TaxID=1490495 RepID=A0A9W6YP60_9STRA|nr:unnamed protein product [Phytophthora fragariaefolia]
MLTDNGVKLPRLIITDRDLDFMDVTKDVFPAIPRLISRWHANQCVEARVREALGEVDLAKPDFFKRTKVNAWKTNAFLGAYDAAMHADTEGDFERRRGVLRQLHSEVAEHLDDKWWKYKEKLVKCWADKYIHFGRLDTRTVDAVHANIERWLDTSNGSLLTLLQKLVPWWKSAVNAVRSDAQREARDVPLGLCDPAFSCVVKKINVHALNETHRVWTRAIKHVHDCYADPTKQQQLKPCTGASREVTAVLASTS